MVIKNEWEINQLVKAGLYSNSDAVLRSALNALFVLHPEQKLRMVIAAYQSSDISLGKAAELMGVSSAEMKEILQRAGVSIPVGPETVDELKKEVTSFES